MVGRQSFNVGLVFTKIGHDLSPIRPLKVDDIITRPPAFFGEAMFGLSPYSDLVGGVTVMNEPGEDLLEVVKRAAGYLRAKIP